MTVINSFPFRCETVQCFFSLFLLFTKCKKKNGRKDTMYKIFIFQQHQVIKNLKSSQMKKYLACDKIP